jgi:tetratricopeptide (TPR) repeat protein
MNQNNRICLLLPLFLLLFLHSFSQPAADMDKVIAAKDYEGVLRAAEAYYNKKDDSAIYIAEKKLIPSKDLHLSACGIYIKGTALYNKDDLLQSRKIMLKLDSFTTVNVAAIPIQYFQWRTFIRLFYIERRLGNYKKAMELIEHCEKTDPDLRHNYKILYAVNNIDLGYYEKGIELFKESIASGKTGGSVPNILNNIGEGYVKYYYKTGYSNYLDSALAYYEKAYTLARQDTINLPLTNALLLLRRGKISFLKKDFQYALYQYKQGLELPIVKQKPFTLQGFELGIADCLYNLSQYQSSNGHLNVFYENFKLFPSSRENLIAAHSLSSQNYEKLNNTQESLWYAKLCLEESKQLGESKEVANDLLHNKTLKEFRNEAQKIITNQKSQNGILLIVGALLFVCILFMYLYIRQSNTISINKNNELKQRLLLTQMNPHFIFNSVDNIQSLIYNGQDKEAISYLTKFSKLTRQILENSRENYITLSEELSMLNNYLTIQKLLYNDKFTYSIAADEGINAEGVCLPPMLTQPFIENAVKHGLKSMTEGGIIQVRFYMKDSALIFEVTNNGAGIESKQSASLQKSLSTQITRERLNSISVKKTIAIHTMNITDTSNTVLGVKTYFEIPYVCNN